MVGGWRWVGASRSILSIWKYPFRALCSFQMMHIGALRKPVGYQKTKIIPSTFKVSVSCNLSIVLLWNLPGRTCNFQADGPLYSDHKFHLQASQPTQISFSWLAIDHIGLWLVSPSLERFPIHRNLLMRSFKKKSWHWEFISECFFSKTFDPDFQPN